MHRFAIRYGMLGLMAVASPLPASADDVPQPVNTYNSQGQVVLATYPNGAALAYTYDDYGNVTAVIQVASPPPPPDDGDAIVE